MAFPGTSIAPVRLIARGQPAFGIILAALGASLIGAGLVGHSEAGRPPGDLPVPPSVEETSRDLVPLSETERSPRWTVLSWNRDEAASDIEVPGRHEPASRPTPCLVVNSVTGPAPTPKECATVSAYLEQTVAMRWLTPGFGAVLTWSETSGYDALEAGRAKHGLRDPMLDPSVDCIGGAEYQETPSCSVLPAPRDEADSEPYKDTHHRGHAVEIPPSSITSSPALPSWQVLSHPSPYRQPTDRGGRS